MDVDTELNDLLRATARADRAAFRLLYDRTSPKLFGITLRICRERPLAEDVLQEVFTEVWRKARDFDPKRGKAMAWMAIIARNRAIDGLRRQSRGFASAVHGTDEELAMTADPNQMEDGGVEHMTLVGCLERLDTKHRDMILRAYYTGETREDLARLYDAPVNTIKTWLRRGLASLKSCLEE